MFQVLTTGDCSMYSTNNVPSLTINTSDIFQDCLQSEVDLGPIWCSNSVSEIALQWWQHCFLVWKIFLALIS